MVYVLNSFLPKPKIDSDQCAQGATFEMMMLVSPRVHYYYGIGETVRNLVFCHCIENEGVNKREDCGHFASLVTATR